MGLLSPRTRLGRKSSTRIRCRLTSRSKACHCSSSLKASSTEARRSSTSIQAAHRLPQTGLQTAQMLVRPGFDVTEPMVAFREDVAQPNLDDLSQAETLPVPMRRKEPIQQASNLHAFELCQQDRDVVNSFYRQLFYFVHAGSLTSFWLTVQQNERTMS